jgi:anti-sigma B factor antagonist
MNVSIGTSQGIPVVRIEGQVDPEDARNLETAAWDALGRAGTRLIVDLESCTYISSAGLAVLFSLARWARSKEGVITVANPGTEVLRLLKLVGLTSERGFNVVQNLDTSRG